MLLWEHTVQDNEMRSKKLLELPKISIASVY